MLVWCNAYRVHSRDPQSIHEQLAVHHQVPRDQAGDLPVSGCVRLSPGFDNGHESVISSLSGMGVDLSLAERAGMTLRDFGGMAGMFLPMIAFGLLIAFMATALICHYWNQWRTPLYIVAGAAALVCVHLALNLAFGITPVAIARTTSGLGLQALAGAMGGYTYVYLSGRYR